MDNETTFRVLFILASIGMIAVRVYYQSKVLRDKRKVEINEDSLSLITGSVAALTSIVFGAEYILFAGAFSFAYALSYPGWIRWLGGLVLVGGVALLGIAHHHLGKSFHSLMVSKEEQTLVESGPYQWIRHPIYTAYLMAYLGGGLLASNWVLTVVPVTMYALLVARRLGQEEKMMEELFGKAYIAYEKRAGQLLPRVK